MNDFQLPESKPKQEKGATSFRGLITHAGNAEKSYMERARSAACLRLESRTRTSGLGPSHHPAQDA
eukprot:1362599-Amphidinium_carterae.1